MKREELDYIAIVFDGPPSHESGRFVECETPDGRSIKAGEWVQRDDLLWELRIPSHTAILAAARGAEKHEAELARLRVENERLRDALEALREAIIRDCIPGGSICDPQQVADAVRAWEPPA